MPRSGGAFPCDLKMHAILRRAREHQPERGRVGRPRGEAPLQVQSPPPQWRGVDHYTLLITLSRRPRPRDWGVAAPLSCPYSPECVEGEFCELRLLGILGSSHSRGSPPSNLGWRTSTQQWWRPGGGYG